MKYVSLDYDQAHAVVDKNQFLDWDGYDIITRRRDPKGYSDKRGVFKNGEWWIQFRYPLADDGTWSVPNIYVNR